jgi:hypothetical protein
MRIHKYGHRITGYKSLLKKGQFSYPVLILQALSMLIANSIADEKSESKVKKTIIPDLNTFFPVHTKV